LLGQVSALWRYPASSLAGEQLDEITVAGGGVAGDRRFGVIEVATGEAGRPDADRKWHRLPLIRTRSSGTGLEVAIPGGAWLAAPSDEADRSLSDFMGFAVSLRPFSREAAPGYAGPLTVSRYNLTPVHLLTTASLARLKQLHPEGAADPRRFRPNIVVDMPAVDGHFPETEWIGRKLSIGDVELTISEPCRRCGFTIIAQDGFGEDPEILRQLVRNNQRNIGVYCTVDRPGSIALGAAMQFA
jgi:uncharacterized protein YcbX